MQRKMNKSLRNKILNSLKSKNSLIRQNKIIKCKKPSIFKINSVLLLAKKVLTPSRLEINIE